MSSRRSPTTASSSRYRDDEDDRHRNHSRRDGSQLARRHGYPDQRYDARSDHANRKRDPSRSQRTGPFHFHSRDSSRQGRHHHQDDRKEVGRSNDQSRPEKRRSRDTSRQDHRHQSDRKETGHSNGQPRPEHGHSPATPPPAPAVPAPPAEPEAPLLFDELALLDPETCKKLEEDLIRQRRERRKAILQRHPVEPHVTTPPASGPPSEVRPVAAAPPTVPAQEPSVPPTHDPALLKMRDSLTGTLNQDDAAETPRAVDYVERPGSAVDPLPTAIMSPLTAQGTPSTSTKRSADTVVAEEVIRPDRDNDNDDDDDDDMFALPKPKRVSLGPSLSTNPGTPGSQQPPPELGSVRVVTHEVRPSLQDNWDDHEGYYRVILGELFDDRYHIFNNLGKGVFSTVIKARDTQDGDREVAIKVIRNNETMYRAGQKEIEVLNKLQENDPEDRKHCVRLIRHFEYRNHLCLVFESLSMNLREVLKKYGRDIGISLKAVRGYARQIFTALALLRRCHLVHADIKPDNILVDGAKSTLKVADFGSAADIRDNDPTPYLASRFYRAPEVILGLPYDYGVDVWSVGCTLYELYTGKILLPGRSNNGMLKLMIDLKGRFAPRLLKRGQFAPQYFNPEWTHFLYQEVDRVTRNLVIRPLLQTPKPTRDLRVRLDEYGHGAPPRLLNAFHDFLDRCLTLNPEKRLTPEEALAHPFIADRGLLS
ncbi:U4/U6 small nuclear ribonucleoprotein prp4 [Tieghemiomyces parasiticus]|uniref:Serine/threonine-protein kinase PRP4 homolog n=1 Tax=Tieghemiomyces parasiticus TaxID=78921 RepID=A0A9W8AFZ4_9FUNG|nr:U4/U6 small nuclear ribonucleoprotein prp4 [Tieghemiomyces parasiticus]